MTITNGLGRDLINADFITYREQTYGQIDKPTRDRLLRAQLDSIGKVALSKYYYHNNGNCTFTNESQLSGINEKAISNGAAYVDLDNDGDLDLVVNNIDGEASIYINNTQGSHSDASSNQADALANHFLNFILRGDSLNRNGFGAKILLYQPGHTVQSVEESPVRGYASSVDPKLHFGLGKTGHADSVRVTWPNGLTQLLQQPPTDTTLILDITHATAAAPGRREPARTTTPDGPEPAAHREPAHPAPAFADITDSLRVAFKHNETFFNDFAFNTLLPQKYSQLGPFISTGDLNGDGLTDFFVGGAFNQSGEVWLQQKNGTFTGKKLTDGLKHEEDMQSILVDVDGDHDLDLIVTGGSSEFDKDSKFLIPRLYLNDGKGNFTLSPYAFPPTVNTIAQTISCTGGPTTIPHGANSASNANSASSANSGAGSPLRIFIGGRVSLDYPTSPKSYLLEYRNGAFIDITQEACPALSEAGMITASMWADIDGDGQNELIIAGEWMPIRIFKITAANAAAGAGPENSPASGPEKSSAGPENSPGQIHLREITDSAGLNNDLGMWRSLTVADVDGDGDLDIIAGNLGENNPYHVTAETPMKLIAKDFQGNGRIDPLLCYYIPDEVGANSGATGSTTGEIGKKTLQLGINLTQLARRIPTFKKKYLKNADYAKAGLADQFPEQSLEGAIQLNCNELHTCWFENLGHGKFRKHILPIEAQFAPVNTILARDLDGDGKLDLLLAGNEYQAEVMYGRYDASYGLFLKGSGNGNFLPIQHVAEGVFIKGDVKDIKCIQNAHGENLILAAINNDRLRILRHK